MATRSEELLWERLRARQFERLKFRRQHPLGPFVLDFYCERLMVAVEVDGGIHETASVRASDAERQALLEAAGVRFIRVRAADVETDIEAVLDTLRTALAALPPPRPATRGEGAGG